MRPTLTTAIGAIGLLLTTGLASGQADARPPGPPADPGDAIVRSVEDSLRFTLDHTLTRCDCGHLRATSSFVDPQGRVMSWHDFGDLEGPGWAANAVGGAEEIYAWGQFLRRPDWQQKALAILDHVLDHGFIEEDTGFIRPYRLTTSGQYCLNYKHNNDWFGPGSLAKVGYQLLTFADRLGDDPRAARMRRAAVRLAAWLDQHVEAVPNGWYPRRCTPEGKVYRRAPDGGEDRFWQTSADGLFLVQLQAELARRGLADYRRQVAEKVAVFIKAGGIFGSINHDTYDPHENVAYSVAFRTLQLAADVLGDENVRRFAYETCLRGLDRYTMHEDRHGVATAGLLYMEDSWDTAYLWENAEAALAYFEAARERRPTAPAEARGFERAGLTILRAIARHHHGPHGFLTEGVDWNNHVGEQHHIDGARFGDIQYTEPFLNNQHIAEPTLFYLIHLATRREADGAVEWLDGDRRVIHRQEAATTANAVTLHGAVVDEDTGAPIAARVYLQGEDGAWHFPTTESPEGSAIAYRKAAIGHPEIVEMHTTLSAHPFDVRLAPGRYRLTVERGKEYHPETRTLDIGAEPARVTVRLRRWIDMAARGWYSGETHVHRTLDELPNVMRAEDLNVAFPLLDWVREAFVAPTARRDASFPSALPEVIRVDATHLILPRNTEYEIFTINGQPHTLGAFFVLNHRRPLDLGVPPVGPVGRRAHDEGALIELDKHNWPWSMALVPVLPVDLFELSNNHVWRTTFAFRDFGEPPAEFMAVERDAQGFTERGWIEFGMQNYYALLDCGFPLRPTAGMASGVHPVPLGFGRVYVHLPDRLDAAAWLRGLDAGRSFVTTGPMLFVTLDGHDPGHHFEPLAAGQTYHLTGSALSAQPLGRIEVIINGEVARTIAPTNRRTERGAFENPLAATVPVEGTSWLAVRLFEDRPDGRVRFAHSAIWHLDVPGRPLRPRRKEVEYLISRVEEQIARSADVLPEPALAEYRTALRRYRAIADMAR